MSLMIMQTSDGKRIDLRQQSLMAVALGWSSAVGRVSIAGVTHLFELNL